MTSDLIEMAETLIVDSIPDGDNWSALVRTIHILHGKITGMTSFKLAIQKPQKKNRTDLELLVSLLSKLCCTEIIYDRSDDSIAFFPVASPRNTAGCWLLFINFLRFLEHFTFTKIDIDYPGFIIEFLIAFGAERQKNQLTELRGFISQLCGVQVKTVPIIVLGKNVVNYWICA